jgi:hypothetical protein
VRRTPIGKAPSASHVSCAGPLGLSPDRFLTKWSAALTGCRLYSPSPASPRSRRSCCAAVYQAAGKTFKIHLDGFNQLPYLTGEQDRGPRRDFFYFNDEGDFVTLRYENWKFVFEEQRAPGTIRIWAEPFTKLRVPKLFDLHADPYERADITSNTYYDWFISNAGIVYGGIAVADNFLQTFKEFPPSQHAATFTIDQAVDQLKHSLGE